MKRQLSLQKADATKRRRKADRLRRPTKDPLATANAAVLVPKTKIPFVPSSTPRYRRSPSSDAPPGFNNFIHDSSRTSPSQYDPDSDPVSDHSENAYSASCTLPLARPHPPPFLHPGTKNRHSPPIGYPLVHLPLFARIIVAPALRHQPAYNCRIRHPPRSDRGCDLRAIAGVGREGD
jgi:hypothetical protein